MCRFRRSPEERAERERARLLAGTTRHLTLPVAADEALGLVREAVARRAPMMRLLDYTRESARVAVAGSLGGSLGTGGNAGAAISAMGGGIGVKLTWQPASGGGTEFTAYAPSTSAMLIMRTEIHSLWRALEDAQFAREQWNAQRKANP